MIPAIPEQFPITFIVDNKEYSALVLYNYSDFHVIPDDQDLVSMLDENQLIFSIEPDGEILYMLIDSFTHFQDPIAQAIKAYLANFFKDVRR